jgi:hypothetical protein
MLFNLLIKTKPAGTVYAVKVDALDSSAAIKSAVDAFAAETGLAPAKAFNVAFVTDAEFAAYNAGTYSPFAAVEAFNAKNSEA